MNKTNQIKKDNFQNLKSLIAFIFESDQKDIKSFSRWVNNSFGFTGLNFSIPEKLNKISYNQMIGNFKDYTGENLTRVCYKYQQLNSNNLKNKAGNVAFKRQLSGFKPVVIGSEMLKREFGLY